MQHLAKTTNDAPTVRRRAKRTTVPEEVWRQAVRKLGTFTTSELAAELGCSLNTAKKHITAMACNVPPLVRPAGRVMGKPAYEYVKPADAGSAFEAQRRLRVVASFAPEADLAPERSAAAQEVLQSRLRMIPRKELREVAREAVAAGWQIQHKAGSEHHIALVKGTQSITLPSTPRNPGHAAQALRRRIFGTPERRPMAHAASARS